ncbi:TonB family protein [Congregicoccus parvus]|uniref:TonB family protein n=1 Tax=Congregicoccus parvus TaxID=3081749 RepID=UPI003FA5BF0D
MRLGMVRVLLALLSAWPVVARGELKLVAVVDGRDLEVVEVRADGMLLRDGATELLAPKDVRWRVDGALESAPELVSWISRYSVVRTEEAARAVDPTEATATEVVYYGTRSATYTASRGPTLERRLEAWPSAAGSLRAIVAVWYAAGSRDLGARVAPVTAERLQHGVLRRSIGAAERGGRPALLVWSAGRFVPLRTGGEDALARRAARAAVTDDVAALRACLAEGVEVNAAVDGDYTLLHVAAEAGALQAVEILLEARPTRAKSGEGPLHVAAGAGRLAAVERLVAAKFSLDAKDERERTPLLRAAESGHLEVVEALGKSKAVINLADRAHRTPLTVAIDSGFADIAQVLWKAGGTVDFKLSQQGRVLITQAGRGHAAMVAWLTERGVNASFESEGMTPLHAAALSGHERVVRVLLEKGVDANRAPTGNEPVLLTAARRGHHDVVAMLLEGGALVDARTASGSTALHFAAQQNSTELATVLLARGADPAAVTERGANVLETALVFGAADVARVVAERGGRVAASGEQRDVFVASVLACDLESVLGALLDEGLPADAKVEGKWSLPEAARLAGAERCAGLLRERGIAGDEEASPVVVPASRLDARLSVVKAYAPEDPRDEADDFPEELVKVEILVGPDGVPLFPRVIEARDRKLVPFALQTVSAWRFASPLAGGEPVAVRVRVPIQFPSYMSRYLEIGQVDKTPNPIKRVGPKYPGSQRDRGVQARVMLTFVVDVEGMPQRIRVRETTGPEFSEAAIAALQQWRFEPGMKDGKPVGVQMALPMIFSLR